MDAQALCDELDSLLVDEDETEDEADEIALRVQAICDVSVERGLDLHPPNWVQH